MEVKNLGQKSQKKIKDRKKDKPEGTIALLPGKVKYIVLGAFVIVIVGIVIMMVIIFNMIFGQTPKAKAASSFVNTLQSA